MTEIDINVQHSHSWQRKSLFMAHHRLIAVLDMGFSRLMFAGFVVDKIHERNWIGLFFRFSASYDFLSKGWVANAVLLRRRLRNQHQSSQSLKKWYGLNSEETRGKQKSNAIGSILYQSLQSKKISAFHKIHM